MLDIEIESALNIIEDCYNPEIHHYQQGKHPGLKWYIKTVLPGPSIIDRETRPLFDFWRSLENRHSKHVRLTESAYNWSGMIVPGWWTIWLDERIDISWSWSTERGFDYQIIDHDLGLKNSGALIETLLSASDIRHPSHSGISYLRLLNIANFLKTFTSEKKSRENRSKIRIMHDDEIFPTASN